MSASRSERVRQLAGMAAWYRKVCKIQGVPHCFRITASMVIACAGSRRGSAPLALLLTTANEWGLGPNTLGDGLQLLKSRGLIVVEDDHVVIVMDMTGVLE